MEINNSDGSVQSNSEQNLDEQSCSCLKTEAVSPSLELLDPLRVPDFEFKIPNHPAPRKKKTAKSPEIEFYISKYLEDSVTADNGIRNVLNDYFGSYKPGNQLDEISEIVQDFLSWYTITMLFQCEICGSKYNSQKELWQHMARDHEAKYWCYLCGISFEDSVLWTTHFSYHDIKERVSEFTCALCFRTCATTLIMREHLKKDHKLTIFPY